MGALLELMFFTGILCVPICVIGFFIERTMDNANRKSD